jgi:uncharacterized protein YcbK (DUF882 family)
MSGPLVNRPAVLAGPNDPVWTEIAAYFKPGEFRFPHKMDAEFLRLLFRIRKRAGVPFRIVSDYRSPTRNESAAGAKVSAHMEVPCRAVDLHVTNNLERIAIVRAAILEGVQRIGVYPAKPDNSGSVHIDASEKNPSPRMWTRY